MTDRNIELTRRKILASVGAVGAAGAATGLGTSAFFSDQETFANNQLTAGALDLKVDWEEHYSDWSDDENTDRTDDDGGDEGGDFEVEMDEPDNPEDFKAFPPGTGNVRPEAEPLIWVPNEFVDDFMDNTSLEAYPDSDNDGVAEFPIEEMNGMRPCEFLADVGDDDDGLVPDENGLGRTDNDDTRLDDDSPAPLINLTDVKPGDFGEITFSTHLCDNPGYLWMNMSRFEASENGYTEPEREDDDESGDADGDGEDDRVELADKLQTAIWYDDCDNLITCEEPLEVMLVVDTSGSISGELGNSGDQAEQLKEAAEEFLVELDSKADDVRAGLLTFNGPGDAGEQDPTVFDRPALRAGLGGIDQFDTDGDTDLELENFLPNVGNGDTPFPYALDLGRKVLNDQGRTGAKKVMVIATDGLPDYNGPDSPTTPYTVTQGEGSPRPAGPSYTSGEYDGNSDGTSSTTEQNESAAVAVDVQGDGVNVRAIGVGLGTGGNTFLEQRIAGNDADDTVAQPSFFYDPSTFTDLSNLAETVAEDIAGGESGCEELIFTGTLREAKDALTGNGGLGLPLVGDLPAEVGGGSGRNCFAASATHCFGFSWWLPLNHGNEVQTDSVSFDLGFYAEQCRHNDGSGMANRPDA